MQKICQKTGLQDATADNVRIGKATVKEPIKLSHLKFLKEEMRGVKLEKMKMMDLRERRSYTKMRVEKARMAFRLEVFQFDCRANMPAKYGRVLRCRACERPPGQQQEDHEEQLEDQEHLECCLGYAELWDGLGPTTKESRVKYLILVKMKRLRQQQKQN